MEIARPHSANFSLFNALFRFALFRCKHISRERLAIHFIRLLRIPKQISVNEKAKKLSLAIITTKHSLILRGRVSVNSG